MGKNVSDLSRSFSLQRNYQWEFILPDISGIPGHEVSKFCQSVSFGEYNMSKVVGYRYGAFNRNYAGDFEIGEVRASFLCPVPDLVSGYFNAWRSLMVNEAGFYYPKRSYAFSPGYIYLLDTDDTKNLGFSLQGLFPKTFPSYNLSYKDNEVIHYDVLFSVDRIVRVP